MRKLQPHQRNLLEEVIRHGRIPANEVDGRMLRPLRSAGLVQVVGQHVEATQEGLRQVNGEPPRVLAQSRLNERQEELLRLVLRLGQLPVDEVDGRVARPLLARGLVAVADGLDPDECGPHVF